MLRMKFSLGTVSTNSFPLRTCISYADFCYRDFVARIKKSSISFKLVSQVNFYLFSNMGYA